MATTRRKPATRSRKAPAKQSAKRSPFGFLMFGLILGLALAAFLSYYLKSSPLPFTQQTSQVPGQPSTGARQPQQAPLHAPTRNSEAQLASQTAPSQVQPNQAVTPNGPAESSTTPTSSIAAQTANNQVGNQHAPNAADPIGAMIDPNSGLVTTPLAQSTARINPDALIKQKPEAAKTPNASTSTTANSNSAADTGASASAATKNTAASNTKPKATTGSGDQIAQLIKTIPAEPKTPSISQNLASAPLRIQAPSSVAATDKGIHLNNTQASSNKSGASTTQASSSPTSGTKNNAAAKKISTQYLQVGSFANYQEADATRARMLLLGFSNVSISKTRVNNTEFNRVRIGPFNDEQALKSSQQKLQSANIQSTVVR